METSETVEMMTNHLKEQISKVRYQLERLGDVALAVEDSELEVTLRGISAEIRRSIDVIEKKIDPNESWFAG